MANAGIAGSARVRSSQVMFTSMPNIYHHISNKHIPPPCSVLEIGSQDVALESWHWSSARPAPRDFALHRPCLARAAPNRHPIGRLCSYTLKPQSASTVIQMHLSHASSVTFVSKLQKYSVIFVTTWSPQVSLTSAFHNCFGLAGDSTPQDPAHADLFHMFPEEWRQATPSHIKPHVVFTNSPS